MRTLRMLIVTVAFFASSAWCASPAKKARKLLTLSVEQSKNLPLKQGGKTIGDLTKGDDAVMAGFVTFQALARKGRSGRKALQLQGGLVYAFQRVNSFFGEDGLKAFMKDLPDLHAWAKAQDLDGVQLKRLETLVHQMSSQNFRQTIGAMWQIRDLQKSLKAGKLVEIEPLVGNKRLFRDATVKFGTKEAYVENKFWKHFKGKDATEALRKQIRSHFERLRNSGKVQLDELKALKYAFVYRFEPEWGDTIRKEVISSLQKHFMKGAKKVNLQQATEWATKNLRGHRGTVSWE